MATTLEERVEQELRLRGLQPRAEAEEEEAPQGEAGAAGADKEKKKKRTLLSRFNVHVVLWILAAVSLTYFVDFFKVVYSIMQENCIWLKVCGLSFSVGVSIMLYCIVYLEWRCGISDYDARYPWLIPIAIVSFLVAGVCLNVSLWAVWSYFTPGLTFTQFMGTVMLVSLFG
ncbi:transmembrane protein 128 [Phyllobates terribilis]|uniref:transmembrane protein 128 n=1 Tax=Phyllobates terribilis TaxID=111132 RepID=UPI003CCA9F3F